MNHSVEAPVVHSRISPLPQLEIRGKIADCIIQGGMGVGVSGSLLTGKISELGSTGTLSAAAPSMVPKYAHFYRDEVQKARKLSGQSLGFDVLARVFLNANIRAMREEIKIAREICGDKRLYMNVMRAGAGYPELVQAACEAGIDGIVSGAGLPFDLPAIAHRYPKVALIPIVSSARGAKIMIDKWMRNKDFPRIPDAITIEDPHEAGGHLGARELTSEEAQDTRLERAVPMTLDLLKKLGLETRVPIIAAGGITTRSRIDEILGVYGAQGVQLATIFAATHESEAHDLFKQAIVDAKEEKDITTYPSSILLLARALTASPVFRRLGDVVAHTRVCAHSCLPHCGYIKGDPQAAQMCVMGQLAQAVRGMKGDKGLWFVGRSAFGVKAIRSVSEVIDELRGRI